MRVLTEKKRGEIVEAAGRAFRAHGYGATTMTLIAQEAGASKNTLYRYFSSKEEVFAAYVVAAGEGHREMLDHALPLGDDCRESLIALGRTYLGILLSPSVMEVNRIVIGEAGRFPELSEIYFRNGPRLVISIVEHTLASAVARGWLRLSDPKAAAWEFKALCERRVVERRLWGFPEPLDDAGLAAHVSTGVDIFLAAYGRRSRARAR